jgi:hypothetical protein
MAGGAFWQINPKKETAALIVVKGLPFNMAAAFLPSNSSKGKYN